MKQLNCEWGYGCEFGQSQT